MVLKTKGIDKVTERLSGLMVITMGPVATMLLGFKALDFSNQFIELSLQTCKWSCVCHSVLPWGAPSRDVESETGSCKLAGFYFQWAERAMSDFCHLQVRPWSWRKLRDQLSKCGAPPASTLCIWPQVWRYCGLGARGGTWVQGSLICRILYWTSEKALESWGWLIAKQGDISCFGVPEGSLGLWLKARHLMLFCSYHLKKGILSLFLFLLLSTPLYKYASNPCIFCCSYTASS